jgi:hypothetical protein
LIVSTFAVVLERARDVNDKGRSSSKNGSAQGAKSQELTLASCCAVTLRKVSKRDTRRLRVNERSEDWQVCHRFFIHLRTNSSQRHHLCRYIDAQLFVHASDSFLWFETIDRNSPGNVRAFFATWYIQQHTPGNQSINPHSAVPNDG